MLDPNLVYWPIDTGSQPIIDPLKSLQHKFSKNLRCNSVIRIADKFTQHNFQEVMEHEEFLLLPLPQLIDIISSDELNVRSEEQVFQAEIQIGFSGFERGT